MLVPEDFNDILSETEMFFFFFLFESWLFEDMAKEAKQPKPETKKEKAKRERERQLKTKEKKEELKKNIQGELKKLLEYSVFTSTKEEGWKEPLKNPESKEKLREIWKRTNGEFDNLIRTTLDQSYSDLKELLVTAEKMTTAGLMSYEEAIDYVLLNYARKGVYVTYPTGAKRELEGAVRCALVTSVNQAAAEFSNLHIKEAGAEYVLTSAHIGARIGTGPGNHYEWQGRVFKIRGAEKDYPNLLEVTGYDIDEDGVGHVVDPTGLHGYNCRHSHRLFDPEINTNPYRNKAGELTDANGNVITAEANEELYRANQKARSMERGIRQLNREISMREALKLDSDDLNSRLKGEHKKYNEFCRENGIRPQYERFKIY